MSVADQAFFTFRTYCCFSEIQLFLVNCSRISLTLYLAAKSPLGVQPNIKMNNSQINLFFI